MILDYLENSVQLIMIITALLISLFRYIGSKRLCWLYSVIFFLGSFLSSYFWTAYLIVMGDYPNASSILAYFGWNTSYMVFMLLLIRIKSKEELRYFHPLMLIPIPLNIWQLSLYLQFGGIANSVYQVAVFTVVSCLSIQGILWHYRKRINRKSHPWFMFCAFLFSCFEFGMWTFSSLEGWVYYLYYPCSFLCSVGYLFFVWSLSQTLEKNTEDRVLIDNKIQNILKSTFVVIVAICSFGGILLADWIRDVLAQGVSEIAETNAYDIIPVILFLISVIISAFAITIIFVVYFEQKVAENNKLREERRVAEQSNSAKSDFLANMSHEIRTPINAILGMNEIVLRESIQAQKSLSQDPVSARKVLEDISGYSGNIDSAGHSLLTIINDILDLSKIEAGKMVITEDSYELSSVLNDVSNMIALKAKAKGLEFTVEVEDDLPNGLYGDEIRIRQVITNILNNAVKYTDEGSVTLSIKDGGSGSEREVGRDMDLQITVSDTGIGIREEDVSHLFEKFERIDLKHNSTIEGTGLGLAITHRLIEMMNGTVGVSSAYGKGSVFTIHLPQKIVSKEPVGDFREKFKKSMEEELVSEITLHAPDARILIVDDTRVNLVVATGLLKDTQIVTDTADSGAEALVLAKQNRYDMILLDQRMPGMDGIETLKRLREDADGINVSTPVICLTADAISGAKERYINEGFTDYLSKPVAGRELRQMLIKYLPSDKVSVDGEYQFMSGSKEREDAGIYEVLRNGGIDTDTGLQYSNNDEELYHIILSEYEKGYIEKTEKMQKCYAEGDLKNYATLVHALKSTSRMIGAVEVSDKAAALERAADENDFETVRAGHEDLVKGYTEVVKTIRDAMGRTEAPEDDGKILEFLPQ
ncbi:MAG: response regulator [Lachnospiraceae bacterium]|nr:response regulator [Lachnospiraceae bacterium]